jgi:hypothetical protein
MVDCGTERQHLAAVFASRSLTQPCSSQMEQHPLGTLHEATPHDNESGHGRTGMDAVKPK